MQRFFIRRHDFLDWFASYDDALFLEYQNAVVLGLYPVWLCYLWCNPEENGRAIVPELSDSVNDTIVPIEAARCYFRTAVSQLLAHRSFESVEVFSDNSSDVCNTFLDNGVIKLSALMGIAVSHKLPVLYIGSGEYKEEQQRAAGVVPLRRVDIGIPGVPCESLLSVKLTEPVIINDAYYEGMEADQRRIAVAKIYYAKQYKVKEDDYLFLLPGLDEPRYQ